MIRSPASKLDYTMKIDSAVAKLLSLDASNTSVSAAGGGGMSSASTSKIVTQLSDGSSKNYFMKTGSGKAADLMFEGEHASLNALHQAVPSLCPASHGHGRLADAPNKSFLVTDYLDLTGRRTGAGSSSGMSLAQKMAKLHTTPAPVPEGYDKSVFGFPASTCCGDTLQPNDYKTSWAEFFAENRLRFILRQCEHNNGKDDKLHRLTTATIEQVVPRLIGDRHLNGGQGITPVVTHGDLWSGNAARGSIGGQGEPEDIVFDPSAAYTHSEYDLGIMNMFGGFGSAFFKEYHKLCPKTAPTEEYEDRVKLYELYHHLNHHSLFGGGYRSGAISIMERLVSKYGKGKSDL